MKEANEVLLVLGCFNLFPSMVKGFFFFFFLNLNFHSAFNLEHAVWVCILNCKCKKLTTITLILGHIFHVVSFTSRSLWEKFRMPKITSQVRGSSHVSSSYALVTG